MIDKEQSQRLSKDIYTRLVRLTVALYRMTDYFYEKEPIKFDIRERVNKALQSGTVLIQPEVSVNRKTIKDIKDSLNSLNVHCDVLEYSQIVSERNCGLIRDEIVSIIGGVENFESEYSIFDQVPQINVTIRQPRQSQRDSVVVEGNVERSVGMYLNQSSKNDRRSKILEHVKKVGTVSIRDLSQVIKGCSEKTIQRELTVLINEGFVRREGDKRWSRYLIANGIVI
ncbi:MAG TPA: DeoR family transcriptional regulator [Candidatus Paceibacterota bacterium]